MPRLFCFKMFVPKAHFNSRGVSGSKPLPSRWLMPILACKWILLLPFHRPCCCCCDKSICRRGCFLWKARTYFLGKAAKFIFEGRKLIFKAANLPAAPGCLQEHNSCLQMPVLNILNLHKIIQNASKGARAVGVLNVQWYIAIISSHLPALFICCIFSGRSRKLQGRRQAAFLTLLFQPVPLAANSQELTFFLYWKFLSPSLHLCLLPLRSGETWACPGPQVLLINQSNKIKCVGAWCSYDLISLFKYCRSSTSNIWFNVSRRFS